MDKHLKAMRKCQECLDKGDTWVHLRLCLACGHVGCCDQSKNKHATKHFTTTGHPIVMSLEPGETWKWCYPDEQEVDDWISRKNYSGCQPGSSW